jgi:DNA-binding transcriptional LysR family regulator
MSAIHVSIEQWRSLNAVVEYGGFAQAAEKMHRSQSAISYNIARLQDQLGITVLEIIGRKAQLTEHGKVIYRRSQQLLREAERLEMLARSLDQGWEANISLVVDTAFPTGLLMQALRQFEPLSQGTRVQLNEVVLSGADDALLDGRADLVIGARAPEGFLGDFLLPVDFIAVAHPAHALHQLGRKLSSADLEKELQVVIHDSGISDKMDVGWLAAEHQWTVSRIETAVAAISSGLGFGWLPSHSINTQLQQAQLKPLPLREGQILHTSLQLIYGNADHTGPATRQLADIIRQVVKDYLETVG